MSNQTNTLHETLEGFLYSIEQKFFFEKAYIIVRLIN